MDLITPILAYLTGALKNNEAVETIADETTSSVNKLVLKFWDKIKPKFIGEAKEMVKDFEGNPEDDTVQGGMRYHLTKTMSGDDTKEEMENLLAEISKLHKGKRIKKTEKNQAKITGDQGAIIIRGKVRSIKNSIKK